MISSICACRARHFHFSWVLGVVNAAKRDFRTIRSFRRANCSFITYLFICCYHRNRDSLLFFVHVIFGSVHASPWFRHSMIIDLVNIVSTFFCCLKNVMLFNGLNIDKYSGPKIMLNANGLSTEKMYESICKSSISEKPFIDSWHVRWACSVSFFQVCLPCRPKISKMIKGLQQTADRCDADILTRFNDAQRLAAAHYIIFSAIITQV